MDAQQQHDFEMSKRSFRSLKGSKAKLEALLEKKDGRSVESLPPAGLDPIAAAMRDNPGLTAERAAELAEAFGF